MNRGRGGNRGGGGGGRHNVSRGKSPQSGGRYFVRSSPVAGRSGEPSAAQGNGSSKNETRHSQTAGVDGVTKKFSGILSHRPNSEHHGVGNISSNDGNPRGVQHVFEEEEQTSNLMDLPHVGNIDDNYFPSRLANPEISARTQHEDNGSACTPLLDATQKVKELSQIMESGVEDSKSPQEVESGKSNSDGTESKGGFEHSDVQIKGFSFDICEKRDKNVFKLNTPLHIKNKAARNEMKQRMQGDNIKVLRPGMVLLKGYISMTDQVRLIKSCRDLGLGIGGFYQPGYRDGAKLHLKMMCLGKNWDPETSMYGDKRPIDEAKPPPIPDDFQHLVKGAIQECHTYLESHSKVKNAREVLPSMFPDVCIINFYAKTGKLGLHQDKDESQESLHKGLPVVSFSLGDEAEFLYGDQRDIDKADKVVLKSGDVLIFGGKSRHIFHGVRTIFPDTAPKPLLDATDFRPGRLNLTFREY